LQSLTRDVKSLVFFPVPGHSTGVFIGTQGGACSCQRHLDPRVTGFIPRIIPRGEVTDSHYGKLYYRRGPNHTCPRSTQFCGPNRTWASLRGEGVGGPIVSGGAFVLSRLSEGGRTGLHPVSALGLSSGFCGSSLRLRKARTKSSSKGWRVHLRPNICPPRDQVD
jgi:hypothetical protein